jgi:hypothetical protein
LKKEIRQLSKGMESNLDGQVRRDKATLLLFIKDLDGKADSQGLIEDEWRIYTYEEKIWQKRCCEKWVFQGDASTCFFHSIANGRKIKCTIFSLEEDGQEISDPEKLREHIHSYYKNLFDTEERGALRLDENFRANCGFLLEEEAETLIEPFLRKKLRQPWMK